MNRFFGYQKRTPENIFGMPTTTGPQFEYDMPPNMGGQRNTPFVPPEELTRPTGAYLGNGPSTQMPEQSKGKDVLGMISKIGDLFRNTSQNFWAAQGGPKGDAARNNQMLDFYKQKMALEAMKGPEGTNDIQNYQFYSKQETEQGRTPMPFYKWKESLNRAGASGSADTKDPMTEMIMTKIKERIAAKLGDKPAGSSVGGEAKGEPVGGGFIDVGDGIKIKFGG